MQLGQFKMTLFRRAIHFDWEFGANQTASSSLGGWAKAKTRKRHSLVYSIPQFEQNSAKFGDEATISSSFQTRLA